MGESVLWILAAIGAIALVVLRHEIASAWRPRNRFQALTALVVVAGGMLAQSELTPSPALTRQLIAVIAVGLLLLAGLTGARDTQRPSGSVFLRPALGALVLWIWLFIVDAFFTFSNNPGTVIARTISGLVLLVLVFAQSRTPLRAVHFTSALLVAVLSSMVLLPFMPNPLGSCTVFKCSEIGVILLGPFASGNYYGLAFAMLGALGIATIRRRRSLALTLTVVAVGLYATNARTSLIAMVVGVVVFVLLNAMFRFRDETPIRRRTYRLLASILGIAAPVVGLLLIATASPDSFSNRGAIWIGAFRAVGERALTGIGIDNWATLQARGEVSYHFAHSEYMTIYFAGGLVAMALFGAVVGLAAYAGSLGAQRPGRGMIVPVVFSILGLLEVVWNPLTVDGLTWIAFAVICSGTPGSEADGDHRFPDGALVSAPVPVKPDRASMPATEAGKLANVG